MDMKETRKRELGWPNKNQKFLPASKSWYSFPLFLVIDDPDDENDDDGDDGNFTFFLPNLLFFLSSQINFVFEARVPKLPNTRKRERKRKTKPKIFKVTIPQSNKLCISTRTKNL
jgi:hypothetical protein